jgi:hypothetical protein
MKWIKLALIANLMTVNSKREILLNTLSSP